MKIRTGFVSNSSSSSFILEKKNLTKEQMNMIYNHIQYANELSKINKNLEKTLSYATEYNAWDIEDKGDVLYISTYMDNFDMFEYLKIINVNRNDIKSLIDY